MVLMRGSCIKLMDSLQTPDFTNYTFSQRQK